MQIGDKATELLKKMTKDDKELFLFGVKEFMIKLADGLHKDLNLQNRILADLRCLAPRNRTAAYEKSIVRLAKQLPPKFLLSSNEIDLLPFEWKYLVLEKIVVDEKISLELYWGKIYQIKDDGGELKFPTLSKVVKKFLSLAEANAPVERAFSQIKHLIGKDRNRLLPETVNALMVTKSHIQSTSSCYNQDINENLMHNVRNSRRLYFDGKKNNNDINDNERGPSGIQLE